MIALRVRRGASVTDTIRHALGPDWESMSLADARRHAWARETAWQETIRDVTAITAQGWPS